MAAANRDEHTMNFVGELKADGHSRVHVGNNTDIRIEREKGGLLKDSYKWILDHKDFRRWRYDRDSRLLWIKGDAGKGKTMLLCGIIINELSQSPGPLPSMLRDRRAKVCYIFIDDLDECETGLPQLKDFIVESTATTGHVKWIVSSRNRYEIDQQLHLHASLLSLELNAHQVAQAINTYIDHKVAHLASLQGGKSLQDQGGLAVLELRDVQSWDTLSILRHMPAGLVPLYRRIMTNIQQIRPHDRELCRLVVSTATVAYCPLHLSELGVLSGLPENISGIPEGVEESSRTCLLNLAIEQAPLQIYASALIFCPRHAITRILF
ncbi:hypothetical protein DER46DRAFT_628522 [Fusarium sp. MPI-SDFR-AT-0072]|nr:hypothetical protein DER46DRAFT_628522 [Fusarium sp. MPI-SDFR-AT-0072]